MTRPNPSNVDVVIVQTGLMSYFAAMTAAIRLVMLLALVLMPFGMGGTAASAYSMPAHNSSASTTHCGEQTDDPHSMHCATCVGLLAADAPEPVTGLKPVAPRVAVAIVQFEGTELEIPTPPPKLG